MGNIFSTPKTCFDRNLSEFKSRSWITKLQAKLVILPSGLKLYLYSCNNNVTMYSIYDILTLEVLNNIISCKLVFAFPNALFFNEIHISLMEEAVTPNRLLVAASTSLFCLIKLKANQILVKEAKRSNRKWLPCIYG